MSFLQILFLVGIVLVLIFSFVIFFGAPFLPTLNTRTVDALKLLNLKPGQTLLELGSGDGRILLAAAEQGIKAIGYELNPLLVLYSRLRTWRHRRLVKIRWANYWKVRLAECDGIYVFLLKPYMSKLDQKIINEARKPIKLVSFAFEIPNRKPTKQKAGMRLYIYS